ncbi:UvrD-helicase domain-containing protein [Streptomyces sp. NPDC047071]|uniref:UvrD-helicase domain-containing protein n=1 Tax=Streptomyces sp. NPDC047071 TaxID=3154808 RepID=UPI003453B624
MTDTHSGIPALTAEQRAVVDQPWDTRLLVTAGAGTGKTHTVVRRLDALVGHEEEALGSGEILVLSFSRAAVRELRERIASHGRQARRVRVQTFDSWAHALLKDAWPDHDWSRCSFDERIHEAEKAIIGGMVETGELGAPAHVVIDEAQDLVGARRNMVETLLDRFQDSCGFTVLGDGAQSVYGFQVSDPDARAAENNYFFDWLRASYADDLVELHLTTNFRARTEEARTALPLGPVLRRSSSDSGEAAKAGDSSYRALRESLLACPDFGELSEPFAVDSLRHYPGTCAVLCRDNRQALILSETLFEHGIPHRLQRSLQDRPVPAWVAGLLRRSVSTTLGEDRFRHLLAELGDACDIDAERAWRSLRGAARASRGLLDLAAVRRLVTEGRFPDDLGAGEPVSLVVSTIHRAKGLEFDRVIVVEPPVVTELSRQYGHVDSAAEARALYVAMTRPREDLYRIAAPSTRHIRRDRAIGRWYVDGPKAHTRRGIEGTDRDVCREHPPGTDGFHHDPAAVQEHLATAARSGDPLVMRRLHDLQPDADQSPPYVIQHRQSPVGMASETFRRDLSSSLRISRTWEVSWPSEIIGFRIDTVEAVAGSRATGSRAGLGEHGVWLVPRVSGLGHYRWGENAQEGHEA